MDQPRSRPSSPLGLSLSLAPFPPPPPPFLSLSLSFPPSLLSLLTHSSTFFFLHFRYLPPLPPLFQPLPFPPLSLSLSLSLHLIYSEAYSGEREGKREGEDAITTPRGPALLITGQRRSHTPKSTYAVYCYQGVLSIALLLPHYKGGGRLQGIREARHVCVC